MKAAARTPTPQASGITSGIRMPIVPHDDPVAKAVAAARMNTSAGSIPGEIVSERSVTR